MLHCVACREEVEGDISLLSKPFKKNVRNNFEYFMLKFQETSLITVTSVENPQFVELPPQRIVGIVRWVLQRAWSGVSGRGSSLNDLFSPFLLSGVVHVFIRTALQSSPCSAVCRQYPAVRKFLQFCIAIFASIEFRSISYQLSNADDLRCTL